MAKKKAPSKAAALMARIDLERPELAAVAAAADPAAAFVEHLRQAPRPRFRFEYERKAEILAFLRANYGAWQSYDTAEADRLAGLSIKAVQRPRGTAPMAELGRAWWATGDARYGAAFERLYLSVPTGEMFTWGSFNATQGSVELDPFFLLLDCDGFTVPGRIAFLDHLHAIADDGWDTHTSNWPQSALGTEGHNWYLHGIHVLPLIGLLFPEFKRSEFLLRTGMSVVEEHLRGHYKADGGARETTLGYQAGCMHNLWDFYLIAQRNGWPLSAGFAERVMAGTRFLLGLTSPAGGLPSFGDGGHSAGGLTALAATAAALTGDPECKWYAEYGRQRQDLADRETPGQIPLGAFWRVGLAGAATYAETRARSPNARSILMGPTGYLAMRGSDQPKANYMAVAIADRGPIVTSHGHNDILGLEVHAGGTRFLGEMGCAPYGDSPGRDYDQKTEAHNCLGVEGLEQVPISSEWRWTRQLVPSVRRWITADTHDFFHGVHEGFYEWPGRQILHARKVLFIKSSPSYWLVFDWLESNIENTYCAWFHGCVPGRARGKSIVLGPPDGQRLAIVPPAKNGLALTRVDDSPGRNAYLAEKKLKAKDCPCFVYRKRAASDCLAWAIVPLASGQAPPTVRRLPVRLNGEEADAHAAVGLEVAFAGGADTVCISHKDFDAELEFYGETAWGHLAFRRRGPGGRSKLTLDHTMADGVCGR